MDLTTPCSNNTDLLFNLSLDLRSSEPSKPRHFSSSVRMGPLSALDETWRLSARHTKTNINGVSNFFLFSIKPLNKKKCDINFPASNTKYWCISSDQVQTDQQASKRGKWGVLHNFFLPAGKERTVYSWVSSLQNKRTSTFMFYWKSADPTIRCQQDFGSLLLVPLPPRLRSLEDVWIFTQTGKSYMNWLQAGFSQ